MVTAKLTDKLSHRALVLWLNYDGDDGDDDGDDGDNDGDDGDNDGDDGGEDEDDGDDNDFGEDDELDISYLF